MQQSCRFIVFAAVVSIMPPIFVANAQSPLAKPEAVASKGSAAVERGRYVGRIAGCKD